MAAKSKNTVKSFLPSLKNPVPYLQRSQIVYQVPCKNCDFVYIGQTKNSLGKRLKQHQYDVKKRNVANSSLANHVFSECMGHEIDWEKAKVIENEPKFKARLLKESYYIQNNKKSMNLAIHRGAIPSKYQQVLANEFKSKNGLESHNKTKNKNWTYRNGGTHNPTTFPNNVQLNEKTRRIINDNVIRKIPVMEKRVTKGNADPLVFPKKIVEDDKVLTEWARKDGKGKEKGENTYNLPPIFPFMPPPPTFCMPPSMASMVFPPGIYQPNLPAQSMHSLINISNPTPTHWNLFPRISQNYGRLIITDPYDWDNYKKCMGVTD